MTEPGIMAHTNNLRTGKTETGGSLGVVDSHPCLVGELQAQVRDHWVSKSKQKNNTTTNNLSWVAPEE